MFKIYCSHKQFHNLIIFPFLPFTVLSLFCPVSSSKSTYSCPYIYMMHTIQVHIITLPFSFLPFTVCILLFSFLSLHLILGHTKKSILSPFLFCLLPFTALIHLFPFHSSPFSLQEKPIKSILSPLHFCLLPFTALILFISLSLSPSFL